jgi:hypothetical protein
MTCLKNRQEYDPERHGNLYAWLVAESARLRYWNKQDANPEPIKIAPPPKSLRGFYRGHSILVEHDEVLRTQQSREYVFEVAKARKL